MIVDQLQEIEQILDETDFQKDAKILKNMILDEFGQLNFDFEEDVKRVYRLQHQIAVCERLLKDAAWIKKNYNKYSHYFANGYDIHPENIEPVLIEVTEKWQSDLFRLARYTWSLPYSSGYGRRIRLLIMDKSNDKIIGLIGLQSPPIDFKIRDDFLNIPKSTKVPLVNQMMDIFTLGAIPPYSSLLGGKLVAMAATSNQVRDIYSQKYTGKVTRMEQQVIPANLIALTTTSAFGRSSIYNRLKYKGERLIAQSIGYTKGYGSFHLNKVYPFIKDFLRKYDDFKGGYGSGPRSVWVNCRKAFSLVGISENLLNHGVQREVFIFPLISNLKSYIVNQEQQPIFYDASFEELVADWRNRWLTGRLERVSDWKSWSKENIERQIILQ